MKTVTFQGQNVLSYAEYGDPGGWPILVQHGMIASIKDGELFHCLIESGARVICAARPGYGESTPYVMKNVAEWGEITTTLADELGLTHFSVLGISSGAPYSYAIGYAMPERVERLYILSGTPALYDARVASHWPYPVDRQAALPELQKLAYELFFGSRPPEELKQDDIRDSMRNDCFGIAQDLKIRCVEWGFSLADIRSKVLMRHSRADEAVPLICVEITAHCLRGCRLEVRDKDPHFSQAVLDDFITSVILRDDGNK